MAMPPITDETAKAIAASANFGTTVVTEGSNLARYVGRIVGTVPEDAVGFLLGDPLRAIRSATAAWYDEVLAKKMKDRGIEHPQPVSLSVAIPLMRGAYDESREGLRDLWANLMATAMDPERSNRVRLSFIETLSKFDPLDALIAKTLDTPPTPINQADTGKWLSATLQRSISDIMLSLDNLSILRCALHPEGSMQEGYYTLTLYGKALVRACSD